MKLVTLFQEANIHPDLIPAVEQLTKKFVDKIQAAGVGFMPAHESLELNQDEPGHRWRYSGYGGSPRWLVGYVKMGPTWLAVHLAIDGSLVTRKQEAFNTYAKVDDIVKGQPVKDIYEDYHRYFRNIDKFITYLHKTLKPFAAADPVQRFMGYVKKLPYLNIKYYPPVIKKIKNIDGGLDDEDEFATSHSEHNVHYGLMSAVDAVSKTIASNGLTDPNSLALVFNVGQFKEWLERSGIEFEIPKGQASVRVSPEETYTINWQGTREAIELPPEISKPLKDFATKVSNKIINLAQKSAKKAK